MATLRLVTDDNIHEFEPNSNAVAVLTRLDLADFKVGHIMQNLRTGDKKYAMALALKDASKSIRELIYIQNRPRNV